MSIRQPIKRTAGSRNATQDSATKPLRQAIALARQGMRRRRGGPFGAVIVKDGKIIGQGCNCVTSRNDPTAHAEIMAIRAACRRLKSFDLSGAVIYSSCEPCPMCLAAIYWARLSGIYYSGSRRDAARAGFADNFLYQELRRPPTRRRLPARQRLRREGQALFVEWERLPGKVPY